MTAQPSSSEFNASNMAYDLRQRYAKLVADHLEDVAIARKSRDYMEWFKSLEDLWVVTQHKFKRDKNKSPTKKYTELRKKVIDNSKLYYSVWTKTSTDQKGIAIIENALRNLEMFIWNRIQEAKMLGDKRETAGLM